MCSLILLSLLFKQSFKMYERVIKICFQRGLQFVKKNVIRKEKFHLHEKIWTYHKRKVSYKSKFIPIITQNKETSIDASCTNTHKHWGKELLHLSKV